MDFLEVSGRCAVVILNVSVGKARCLSPGGERHLCSAFKLLACQVVFVTHVTFIYSTFIVTRFVLVLNFSQGKLSGDFVFVTSLPCFAG